MRTFWLVISSRRLWRTKTKKKSQGKLLKEPHCWWMHCWFYITQIKDLIQCKWPISSTFSDIYHYTCGTMTCICAVRLQVVSYFYFETQLNASTRNKGTVEGWAVIPVRNNGGSPLFAISLHNFTFSLAAHGSEERWMTACGVLFS